MNAADEIISSARTAGASDIHISEGLPLFFRVHGRLEPVNTSISAEASKNIILTLLPVDMEENFRGGADADFTYVTPDGHRHRVNIFRQMGKIAATIRLLNNHIPPLAQLGLPDVLTTLANKPRGLILVTGPTGSGKSTTLASMIDYINKSRPEHIVTVEDPVEYVYERGLSVIHQRELGRDTPSFASALRSVLREDPDVILIGEMRDYETISAALTAAETGHLVMSTLHTTGAALTIDRIIDACPGEAQQQIRTQLAGILCGIVTQCLIKKADGSGRCVATEVLIGTDAVLNIIREDKCHQLGTLMQSGSAAGMHTLNSDLARLVRTKQILREDAYKYTNDAKSLNDFLPV